MLLAFTAPKMSVKTQSVVDHAIWQTTQDVTYDGSWRKIDYPGGDVPANIGVCTDVIIRAYRAIDVDLQVLIHQDMKKALPEYNKRYKTKVIDRNIDHRRTQNMETFFTRQGAKLPITNKGSDYKPGDIVFWNIAFGHVGIVVDEKVPGTDRYKIVHNIGAGPEKEDFLFVGDITGHYRWYQ
jgi:uncharacterized protein YijF (DUF1287 family)